MKREDLCEFWLASTHCAYLNSLYAPQSYHFEGIFLPLDIGWEFRSARLQLWNTFHAHDHAKTLAKHQLKLWGIDYFDLFLVHFPISLKVRDPSILARAYNAKSTSMWIRRTATLLSGGATTERSISVSDEK